MSDTRRLALELHEIRQLALGHATNPQFGNSSVDGEGLSFRDSNGDEIGRIGGGENGMEVEYTYGPKPLMPSTPIVTADANLLLVRWDGQWAGGNEDGDAVADPGLVTRGALDRVEIHASMDPSFVPDPILSFAGVLPVTDEGGAHTVGPLAEAGDYYVVLMARGKDGQYSAPSQRVHVVTTVGLMENELFDLALRADEARESADGKNTVHYGEEPEAPEGGFSEGDLWFDTVEDPETNIRSNTPHLWDPSANNGEGGWVSAEDGRVQAIQDAQESLREDVENIVVDANGNATFWLPEEPDETTEPTPKTGDIWFNTSDGNKLHRFDGQGWVPASDSRFQTIQDAQDDLAAEVDTVRTSVDGKSRITQSISTPPNQYDGAVGDRWERMSSMGSGGRMISNWSWNGDVWVSSLLSDAVIANLDAAKISTGFLDAARLEAGSVLASSIAVGDFSNLATVDPVRDINVTRPANWSTETIGDYIHSKETSQDVLMFKDRTDTVPFKAGDALRISFLAIANDYIRAAFRIWAYPQDAEGGASGQRQISTSTFVFEEGGERRVEATLDIPDDFGDGVVYRSWILGMAPHSTSSPMYNLGVRDVSVYRMTGRTLIQDGAITTDKIAVGAITSDSGIFGEINAGILTAGEIAAARIGAKSITGDKLLIGGTTNLLPGGDSIADSTAGWSAFGRNTSDPSVWLRGQTTVETDAGFPLRGGTTYRASVDVRASVSGARFFWQLLHIEDRVGPYAFSGVEVGAGYSSFESEFTVPESGDYVLRVYANHSSGVPNSGYMWFRHPRIAPMTGATLIEDGAITTDKIAAGAITAESGIIGSLDAGVITVGELRGELIRAQSIAGESLAVDAIDGKTITGATVRTSSAGARVEMDSSGLFVKNSVGANTVSMTNGTLTMTGGTITGGTIRTSSTGARVQLDTGGLKAWNPSNEETFSVDANTGTVNMTGNLYSRPEPADSRVVIDNALVMNRITGEDGAIEEKDNAGLLIGTEAYNTVLYTRIPDGNPFTSTPPGTWLIGPDSRSSLSFNGGDGIVGLSLKTQISKIGRQAILTGSESDGMVTWETKTESRFDTEYSTRSLEQSSDTAAQTFVQSRRKVATDGFASISTYLPTGGKGDIGLTAGNEVALQAGGNVVAKTGGSRVEMQDTRIDITERGGRITVSNDVTLNTTGDLFYQAGRHRADYNPTTGSASVRLTTSGFLGNVSSSRRYKIAIEPMATTITDVVDKLLSIEPKTWFDKSSAERLSDSLTANTFGQDSTDDLMDLEPLTRIPGVIAEELHDAGLEVFVEYNDQGAPESVMYDRLGVALVPAVKSLRDRVNELERMMGEMANA